MNGLAPQAIVRRLIWREYLATRTFWWAMLLLAIGIEGLVMLAMPARDARDYTAPATLLLPLVYALALAATGFNREREQGTLEWLRQLPLQARPLWIAKVSWPLLTAPLLLVATAACEWLLRWLMSGADVVANAVIPIRSSQVANFSDTLTSHLGLTVGIWLLALLVVVGLGSSCSIWIRSPLSATVITAVLVIGIWLALVTAIVEAQQPDTRLWLLVVTGLVVVAASTDHLWRLPRWFWGDAWGSTRQLGWESLATAATATARQPLTSSWQSTAVRLLWTSRWLRCGIAAMQLVLLLLMFWQGSQARFGMGTAGGTPLDLLTVALLWSWPLAVGGTLFAKEQAGTMQRFLAERGTSGWRIWSVRQLEGSAFLLVMLAALMVMAAVQPQLSPSCTWYLGYLILAYAAAQYASLVARNVLVALTVATLLGGVLMGYWTVCAQYLALPVWLTLLPAAGWLAGTAVRLPGWLLADHRPSAWARAAAPPLLALTATYGALCVYRVVEIPLAPELGPLPSFTALVAPTEPAATDESLAAAATARILSSGRTAWEAAVAHDIDELLTIGFTRLDFVSAAETTGDEAGGPAQSGEGSLSDNAPGDISMAPEGAQDVYIAPEGVQELAAGVNGSLLRADLPANPPATLAEDDWAARAWTLDPRLVAWADEAAEILTEELHQAIDTAVWLRTIPLVPHADWIAADAQALDGSPRIQPAATLCRLLAIDGHRRADAQDWTGSMRSYQAALKLLALLRREGSAAAETMADWEESCVLTDLVLWADLPGQQADRVRELAIWLSDYHASLPPPTAVVAAEHERQRAWVAQDRQRVPAWGGSLSLPPFSWLPGTEDRRADRLDDLMVRHAFSIWQQVATSTWDHAMTTLAQVESSLEPLAQTSRLRYDPLPLQTAALDAYYDRITMRRARLTQLRVLSHHLATGYWPTELDEPLGDLPGHEQIPAETVVEPRTGGRMTLELAPGQATAAPTLSGLLSIVRDEHVMNWVLAVPGRWPEEHLYPLP